MGDDVLASDGHGNQKEGPSEEKSLHYKKVIAGLGCLDVGDLSSQDELELEESIDRVRCHIATRKENQAYWDGYADGARESPGDRYTGPEVGRVSPPRGRRDDDVVRPGDAHGPGIQRAEPTSTGGPPQESAKVLPADAEGDARRKSLVSLVFQNVLDYPDMCTGISRPVLRTVITRTIMELEDWLYWTQDELDEARRWAKETSKALGW